MKGMDVFVLGDDHHYYTFILTISWKLQKSVNSFFDLGKNNAY